MKHFPTSLSSSIQFQIWSSCVINNHIQRLQAGFLQRIVKFRRADYCNRHRKNQSMQVGGALIVWVQQAMLSISARKRRHAATMQTINSKRSPPVGCWFWLVPRSMLLEAFTCWNCHWFGPGDWGWAEEELWETSLEKQWMQDTKIFFLMSARILLCFDPCWIILQWNMNYGNY